LLPHIDNENIGRYWCQGDYEAAQSQLEQALALARQPVADGETAGQRWVEAQSICYLGFVAVNKGHYDEARRRFEQALGICREIGDRRSESSAVNSLGVAAYYQGDVAAARAYWEQALQIRRDIGFRGGEGVMLINLSATATDLGDYAGARAYLEQALHIARETGDPQNEAIALRNLGSNSDALGDYQGARACLEEALRICCQIGDRQGESIVRYAFGLLCHHLGDQEAARGYCQQSLQLAQELGDRRIQGYAWTTQGHALAGLKQWAEAAADYRQAPALRRELGEEYLAMESLAGLARVSLAQGDRPQAQAQVEEILRHLEGHAPAGMDEPFRVYLTGYQVLQATADPRAEALLKTAHRLLQEWAAQIGDEALRRSFLENVAAHREILAEFAKSPLRAHCNRAWSALLTRASRGIGTPGWLETSHCARSARPADGQARRLLRCHVVLVRRPLDGIRRAGGDGQHRRFLSAQSFDGDGPRIAGI
jgi:tetratricopeptide (TPR) repeat protein